MKNFIYKYLLKPKHERTPITENERIITHGITAIAVLIGLMIIGHYTVEIFKFTEVDNITDTCRTKYIVSDITNGKQYLCKSYLHNGKYYILTDENTHGSNIYINRRYNINDDGTINDGMYKNPLKYTAQ